MRKHKSKNYLFIFLSLASLAFLFSAYLYLNFSSQAYYQHQTSSYPGPEQGLGCEADSYCPPGWSTCQGDAYNPPDPGYTRYTCPSNNASCGTTPSSLTIAPGSTQNITVSMNNTGDPWEGMYGYGDPPYKLKHFLVNSSGSVVPGSEGFETIPLTREECNFIPGFGPICSFVNNSIPSGGSFAFTFPVTAPSTSGNYTLKWQMYRDQTNWYDINTGDSTSYQMTTFGSECTTPVTSMALKSCTVRLSSNIVNAGQEIGTTLTAQGGQNSSEPAQLWVEKADGGVINPAPGTLSTYNFKNYYLIDSCQTNSNTSCTKSRNLNLPVGNYYVHCDLATQPNRCTGDPFCTGNEVGGTTCTGWNSCSADDAKPFYVITAPTPTAIPTPTPAPNPLGQLNANPLSCTAPCSSTVTWNTTNTQDAYVDQNSNRFSNSDSGSAVANLTSAGTYIFRLFGRATAGSAYIELDSKTVTAASAPTPTPTSTPAPVPAFLQTTGGDVHSNR